MLSLWTDRVLGSKRRGSSGDGIAQVSVVLSLIEGNPLL